MPNPTPDVVLANKPKQGEGELGGIRFYYGDSPPPPQLTPLYMEGFPLPLSVQLIQWKPAVEVLSLDKLAIFRGSQYSNLDKLWVPVSSVDDVSSTALRAMMTDLSSGGGGGGGGGPTLVSAGTSPAEAALARLQRMIAIQEAEENRRSNQLNALANMAVNQRLAAANASEAARQAAAYAAPTDSPYFPGFAPGGPVSYIHNFLGLPTFEGFRYTPVSVPTGVLAMPSPWERAIKDVLQQGPVYTQEDYQKLLEQIQAEPPVVI